MSLHCKFFYKEFNSSTGFTSTKGVVSVKTYSFGFYSLKTYVLFRLLGRCCRVHSVGLRGVFVGRNNFSQGTTPPLIARRLKGRVRTDVKMKGTTCQERLEEGMCGSPKGVCITPGEGNDFTTSQKRNETVLFSLKTTFMSLRLCNRRC